MPLITGVALVAVLAVISMMIGKYGSGPTPLLEATRYRFVVTN
ncbi:hypothetical protein [Agrobacterium rosae]|uniref:Uncharacterized protein n=1 Tax=Agrobacterium rosae TaxID=1972867 RepID=A0AAW9FR46_9HYPH|nr:hypothetical protein [Agrobacterium rosae]MDX8305636.1 hypothetical protein [Agrobacterium rosae]